MPIIDQGPGAGGAPTSLFAIPVGILLPAMIEQVVARQDAIPLDDVVSAQHVFQSMTPHSSPVVVLVSCHDPGGTLFPALREHPDHDQTFIREGARRPDGVDALARPVSTQVWDDHPLHHCAVLALWPKQVEDRIPPAV